MGVQEPPHVNVLGAEQAVETLMEQAPVTVQHRPVQGDGEHVLARPW